MPCGDGDRKATTILIAWLAQGRVWKTKVYKGTQAIRKNARETLEKSGRPRQMYPAGRPNQHTYAKKPAPTRKPGAAGPPKRQERASLDQAPSFWGIVREGGKFVAMIRILGKTKWRATFREAKKAEE